MSMFYTVRFRQSMCDIWVTRLHDGGEPRKYYDLEAALEECQRMAKVYGVWNAKVVDKFGMTVRL